MHEKFIFASSRKWNRPFFEQLESEFESQWIWVSTSDELNAALKNFTPRYIFFVHWNWLVPEDIYLKYECVCFHMTDVPYGRGGSPLQNLILAGHTKTKLTALKMIGEMDAGPVYTKYDLDISGSAQDIYMRATELSIQIIKWMISNDPTPVPQTGNVVIFKRRKPEQSRLPEAGDLRQLYDFIRMLDAEDYPKAFLEYGNFRLELHRARYDIDDVVVEARIITTKHDE